MNEDVEETAELVVLEQREQGDLSAPRFAEEMVKYHPGITVPERTDLWKRHTDERIWI